MVSITCWAGSALLALKGLLMIQGVTSQAPSHGYTSLVSAVMMFGWACLLVWAERHHVFRKGVFFLSALVAAGLLFAEVFGFIDGALPLVRTMVSGAILGGMTLSFTVSYVLSRRAGCPGGYGSDRDLTLQHLLTRIL
jgi:hypothetical protein